MAQSLATITDLPVPSRHHRPGPHRHDEAAAESLPLLYRGLIEAAGEDVSRDGLLKTPQRAAKAWNFLTSGYEQDPVELLRSAVFEEDYSSLVLVRDVEFYSLCEHHLLPFFGRAHVAYVPDGRIVGLSKVPRMLDAIARRLQVQERMTKETADAITTALQPKGVAVWIEASHMCMMMRGVEKQGSTTATSVFTGVFETDERLRQQFLAGIRNGDGR
jgi:GTP cyclohydrolase I